MANPLMSIMNQVSSGSGNLSNIANLIGLLKGSNNPMSLLKTMSSQNPELNQVMQLCEGRNPQQVFYELCERNNINPNEMKNIMNKLGM